MSEPTQVPKPKAASLGETVVRTGQPHHSISPSLHLYQGAQASDGVLYPASDMYLVGEEVDELIRFLVEEMGVDVQAILQTPAAADPPEIIRERSVNEMVIINQLKMAREKGASLVLNGENIDFDEDGFYAPASMGPPYRRFTTIEGLVGYVLHGRK